VRVVNVSSIGHYVVPPDGIQWSTLSPGDDYLAVGKKICALKLYGQSKLVMKWRLRISAVFFKYTPLQGNILFSNEFARQYGGEGIVSISVHPGNINTDLARNASAFTKILGRIITYPVSYGAINSLYAGTSPAASELNGKVSIPASDFAW